MREKAGMKMGRATRFSDPVVGCNHKAGVLRKSAVSLFGLNTPPEGLEMRG